MIMRMGFSCRRADAGGSWIIGFRCKALGEKPKLRRFGNQRQAPITRRDGLPTPRPAFPPVFPPAIACCPRSGPRCPPALRSARAMPPARRLYSAPPAPRRAENPPCCHAPPRLASSHPPAPPAARCTPRPCRAGDTPGRRCRRSPPPGSRRHPSCPIRPDSLLSPPSRPHSSPAADLQGGRLADLQQLVHLLQHPLDPLPHRVTLLAQHRDLLLCRIFFAHYGLNLALRPLRLRRNLFAQRG